MKLLGGVGVVLAACAPTTAQPDAICNSALNSYNRAVAQISEDMEGYAMCVSLSKGRDDCSSEFFKLELSQNYFKNTVSNIEFICR